MGKTVLITGGTSGIGLAMAEAFLRQGARVAVCGRSPEALERFSRAHPEALAIRADVTDEANRVALLDEVAARFGQLDILVNMPALSWSAISLTTPKPRRTSRPRLRLILPPPFS